MPPTVSSITANGATNHAPSHQKATAITSNTLPASSATATNKHGDIEQFGRIVSSRSTALVGSTTGVFVNPYYPRSSKRHPSSGGRATKGHATRPVNRAQQRHSRARPYHTGVSSCKLTAVPDPNGNPRVTPGIAAVGQPRRAPPDLSNPTVIDRPDEVGGGAAHACPYTTSNVNGQRPSAPQ